MEGRISLRRFQRSVKNCVEKQETEGLAVELRKIREAFANSRLIRRSCMFEELTAPGFLCFF